MHRQTHRIDRFLFASIAGFIVLFTQFARAAEGDNGRQLQLEVTINGQPTKFITPFTDVVGRGLATTRGELAELRLKPPGQGAPSDLVQLTTVPGLKYKVDEAAQTIDITVGDELRLRQIYDVNSREAAPTAGTADYGLVTNYSVFANSAQNLRAFRDPTFAGTNVTLDNRFITPYGVFNNNMILGQNVAGATDALRLDSYVMRVDPESLMTYRAGDFVTGGLGWTRPIRMAGMQAQQNYVFRPDLVTTSLPSYSGSAAVPSTVDVYINNVKSLSQQVGAGPYQLSNLPVVNGTDARVVVRDASGKETQTSLAFFSSPRLLKEGVYETSAEVGAPRLRFGIVSDDYEAQPVGSGTLRMGLSDWLTVEGHGESGMGVTNGGAGVVARAGSLGVANLALSGSTGSGRSGAQTYVSLDTKLGPVSVHASSQRAIAGYDDVAAATARLRPALYTLGSGYVGISGIGLGTKPVRSLDNLSFSVPIGFDKSSISTSFLQATTDDGQKSRLVTVSYSRPLFADANMYATAFRDFTESKGTGIYVGITMPLSKTPLGSNVLAAVGISSNAQGHGVVSDVNKSLDGDVGSWGWRVRDSAGTQSYQEAGVSTRTAIARLDAGVHKEGDGLLGRFQADGAVVMLGGRTYLTNRINDGFAVVSAGTPGLVVKHDNRVVGETDEDGRLLVPNLRSHHSNKIEIDPTNLPIDAELDATSRRVTPAFRSGVDVDFDVKTSVQAAIVNLKNADGAVLPPGSEVMLAGDATPHVIGYDGQVYLNKLKSQNEVTIKLAQGGSCRASFAYVATPGTQSVVGPVICQ